MLLTSNAPSVEMADFILSKYIILTTLSILIVLVSEVTEVSSVSCPISRTTVQHVENCPNTEEKWRKAAVRKNCSRYADKCEKPESLVYHCVINAFINETLEVCAYAQYIASGYCAEYNEGGNSIERNYGTNCSAFTLNPCPNFYLSNEAFKYPGCYNLVKKSAPMTDDTSSSSPLSYKALFLLASYFSFNSIVFSY